MQKDKKREARSKKTDILIRDILEVIAIMHHMGYFTISGVGLLIQKSTLRIDLTVQTGLSGFIDVTTEIADE